MFPVWSYNKIYTDCCFGKENRLITISLLALITKDEHGGVHVRPPPPTHTHMVARLCRGKNSIIPSSDFPLPTQVDCCIIYVCGVQYNLVKSFQYILLAYVLEPCYYASFAICFIICLSTLIDYSSLLGCFYDRCPYLIALFELCLVCYMFKNKVLFCKHISC